MLLGVPKFGFLFNMYELSRGLRKGQLSSNCGLTLIAVIALQVQIMGSVVYSNYSVRVQVVPSPPLAFIQGGTNIFINKRNGTVVTLDGQRSYDPDFPMSPVRYRNTFNGYKVYSYLATGYIQTQRCV